jgi:hypothetical protein
MVTARKPTSQSAARTRRGGMLITEAVIAMGILVIAVVPLGYLFLKDARLFRMAYQRAVAVEMVDGEMEILAAGEWRSFPDGTHIYPAPLEAATRLPPGCFQFIRSGKHLRLEWSPAEHKTGIGTVVREVTVK